MIAVTQQGDRWSWSVCDRYGEIVNRGLAEDEADAIEQAWRNHESDASREEPPGS